MADRRDFDVIVIGSGITGGWAAKEFCERGFRTLVLERGRDIEHGGPEYRDADAPWELPNRDLVPESFEDEGRYTMLRRKGWPYKYSSLKFFADEKEYPYSFPPERPFMWTRGFQLGGRSLTWGRQTYRWGPADFEANNQDGHGVDWPIRYGDLAPWYDHVEHFIGVSGSDDGLAGLPSGVFQKPWTMSGAEAFVAANLARTMPDRPMIISRCAHLTEPTEEQQALGRGPCQARNHCMRGCSYGAYFSSLSGTLPAARNTGNLTIVTHAIVDSIIHDRATGRVSGVRAIDEKSLVRRTYTGKLVFLCAGSIASLQILLNSRSAAFPDGLANSSGMLGRRIMDHLGATGAKGRVPGFGDRFAFGRRPTGAFIPNYRHDVKDGADFVRGFTFEIGSSAPVVPAVHKRAGIGAQRLGPGVRRAEPVRHGRCLHVFDRRAEPVADLHGDHGAGRRLCRKTF
jgi:choline dehydrogenase-like flavoprotein